MDNENENNTSNGESQTITLSNNNSVMLYVKSLFRLYQARGKYSLLLGILHYYFVSQLIILSTIIRKKLIGSRRYDYK